MPADPSAVITLQSLLDQQRKTRKVSIADFGGLAEIADLVGCSEQMAYHYFNRRRTTHFPEPRHRIRASRLWYMPDVAVWWQWYQSNKPKGGAPVGNRNNRYCH